MITTPLTTTAPSLLRFRLQFTEHSTLKLNDSQHRLSTLQLILQNATTPSTHVMLSSVLSMKAGIAARFAILDNFMI